MLATRSALGKIRRLQEQCAQALSKNVDSTSSPVQSPPCISKQAIPPPSQQQHQHQDPPPEALVHTRFKSNPELESQARFPSDPPAVSPPPHNAQAGVTPPRLHPPAASSLAGQSELAATGAVRDYGVADAAFARTSVRERALRIAQAGLRTTHAASCGSGVFFPVQGG